MIVACVDHELTTAKDALADNLRGTKTELTHLDRLNIPFEIPYELSIPDRAIIGKTGGNGIAYNCLGDNAQGREVREIFDKLVVELERRMR